MQTSKKKILSLSSTLLTFAFLVMCIAGQSTYTSVGIDHDINKGNQVLSSIIRLRWTGDGAIWVGGSGYFNTSRTQAEEFFDLGAAFFKKPRIPTPRSSANQRGYWFISDAKDDPFSRKSQWCFWLAAPAWIPVFLFAIFPIWQGLQLLKSKTENI